MAHVRLRSVFDNTYHVRTFTSVHEMIVWARGVDRLFYEITAAGIGGVR